MQQEAGRLYGRRLVSLVEMKEVFQSGKRYPMDSVEFFKWKSRTDFLLSLLSGLETCSLSVSEKLKHVQVTDSAEALEQHFYSLGIKAKAKLTPGDSAWSLPISQVYEQAMDQQVPVPEWKTFVRQVYRPGV